MLNPDRGGSNISLRHDTIASLLSIIQPRRQISTAEGLLNRASTIGLVMAIRILPAALRLV